LNGARKESVMIDEMKQIINDMRVKKENTQNTNKKQNNSLEDKLVKMINKSKWAVIDSPSIEKLRIKVKDWFLEFLDDEEVCYGEEYFLSNIFSR